MPNRYCRNFQGPAAVVANKWAHSAISSHNWSKGAKSWGSNSKPFEVINEAGLVGVAKPGNNVSEPELRRAAHEKLASDLAFLLELPIPPVTLCDAGNDFPELNVAVSAWAFQKAEEWQNVEAQLSEDRRNLAGPVSSAMAVFDTWIAASDRKHAHILVNDDVDEARLDLAYIDYAFAFTKEWKSEAEPLGDLRPALPLPTVLPLEALDIMDKIKSINSKRLADIVNRVPASYLSDEEKQIIFKNLLSRREALRGLVPTTGGS